MKKLIAFLTVAGMLTLGVTGFVMAQDQAAAQTEQTAETPAVEEAAPQETLVAETDAPQSFHQVLKQKFIDGSPGWMFPVLLVLILGLGLSIERIIYLNLSTTNTQKLLNKVETALEMEGVAAAKDICKNTRGPVASIFFQGLDRHSEGLEIVEKSIVSYGGVLMARLENNLSWIGLFIALAPMLGFLGTVVGMVQAFEDIEAAGDISPTIVAGGMKVALLTTVFGLIVAIILQIFYNYIISKIDGIVNSMEDATISFMDILVRQKNTKK
ncbi:MAG: MotA/TolQ/ExbB proton channel family protein [Lentimicrobium sp.]|nr:MotA/TolQ/ExbB proton channel family protein [Lentimicrobium sp.]